MGTRRNVRMPVTMGGHTGRPRGACRAQCDPGPPVRPVRPARSHPRPTLSFRRRYSRMSQIEQFVSKGAQMTHLALARQPGGCAASRPEHMTSGHVATAAVSRKSRRQHAPGSRYGRYGTSRMRRFAQLSRVRDDAGHRGTRRYTRLFALQIVA